MVQAYELDSNSKQSHKRKLCQCKKSVILSAEKEQPAENKVTGQQSEVTRPVHTIVSDSSAANPVRDKLQSESEQIQDDGVKDLFQQMVNSYKNLNLHLVESEGRMQRDRSSKKTAIRIKTISSM